MKRLKYGIKVLIPLLFMIIFLKSDISGYTLNWLGNVHTASGVIFDDNEKLTYKNFYGAENESIFVFYMTIEDDYLFCLNPGLSAPRNNTWKMSKSNFEGKGIADILNIKDKDSLIELESGEKLTKEQYIEMFMNRYLFYKDYNSLSREIYDATQLAFWRFINYMRNNTKLYNLTYVGTDSSGKSDEDIIKQTLTQFGYEEEDIDFAMTSVGKEFSNFFEWVNQYYEPKYLETFKDIAYYYYPNGDGSRDPNTQLLIGSHIPDGGGGSGGRRWRWPAVATKNIIILL